MIIVGGGWGWCGDHPLFYRKGVIMKHRDIQLFFIEESIRRGFPRTVAKKPTPDEVAMFSGNSQNYTQREHVDLFKPTPIYSQHHQIKRKKHND